MTLTNASFDVIYGSEKYQGCCVCRKNNIIKVSKKMADNEFLLHPFSTIISLALIVFMPRGVKIGIQHNRFEYYMPNIWHTLYRSVMDKLRRGYSRTAVLHLKVPITKAIEWYGSQETAPLFALAQRGVNLLRDTYSPDTDEVSRTVTQLIDTYSETIGAALTNMTAPTPAPRLTTRPESNPSSDDSDSDSDGSQEDPSTSIRSCWTVEEIRVILGMFALLSEHESERLRESRVNTIITFIDGKYYDLVRVMEKHVYE